MQRDFIGDLVAKLRNGSISRRDFMARAAAIGISGTLISQAVNAAAQSASPEASPAGAVPQKAYEIGEAGAVHPTDTSKGTINLYSSWPLTGASTQVGGDAVTAGKLALSDFGNAAGGFALTYTALDDGLAANNGAWDTATETDNITKVVNDPDAVVYLGTYNSGAAEVSIPISNQAGLAQISYANTYPGLTKSEDGVTLPGEPDVYYPTGKRTYLRTVVADDIQGSAAATWAYNTMGKRKAYVLDDNQAYGKGVATVFQLSFKALGGEILGMEAFDPAQGDYQSLASSIADKGPDVVYVGAIVNLNTPKVVQDLRDYLSPDDAIIIVPDGMMNQAFIDGAGDAANQTYITFGGVPASNLEGAGKDYADRVKAILGHDPDAYATYAYETMVVVLQAIDRAGVKDRAKIVEELFATKDFYSLRGTTWSFDENGDIDLKTMGLNQVQDGVITFLQTIP